MQVKLGRHPDEREEQEEITERRGTDIRERKVRSGFREKAEKAYLVNQEGAKRGKLTWDKRKGQRGEGTQSQLFTTNTWVEMILLATRGTQSQCSTT
jgi:hypothetical protein